MAICTSLALVSGVQVLSPTAVDPSVCSGPVVLSSTEYVNWTAQIAAFGWDSGLFEKTWQGGLLIFATGFGVGLLISLVRKFRI